jgi:uncharacterized membrane protein YhaH (DUF805 family)
MINYWKAALSKYADFNGRARRSEYWYFALTNILITLALYVLIFIGAVARIPFVSMVFGGLVVVFALGTIIPSIAVLVRRLHDTGKSGWYYFVSLIPIAGPIWLLVLLCTEGNKGPNEYGEDPKDQVSTMNEAALDSHLAS